jgi:uncharacterized membrane protein
MPPESALLHELNRLSHVERTIVEKFIRRQRLQAPPLTPPLSLGDRVADKVAAFGGSWRFISIAIAIIATWMLVNIFSGKPFDPYPYILLNLVLSCLAALQAPIIMMSQNRQAAHDRIDQQHDYEINTKAEIEIVALHTKLDEIRDEKWIELMQLQQRQLELLTQLSSGRPSAQ